ncbi:hypothetical protein VSDG_09593 [Cytospora chrysosperma]|uniref:Uncharacterized protein n=1 Tax=Cytospora chrysosperma TaxID=252740 RepID=A0A423VA74_CYTCH|nr:hypothetical protein VSDG_09593 [Valsa sordida]
MATLEIDTHNLNSFSPDDFETSSIRSAAPSYISEAPSYHTTVSTTEPVPPYSPPEHNSTAAANAGGPTRAAHNNHNHNNNSHNNSSRSLVPSLLPSHTAHIHTPGLPPIPPAGRSHPSPGLPSLGAFRIPSWSTVNTNPTYHRVANRRAQAAMNSGEGLLRNATRILERVNEEVGASAGGASGSATPDNSDGRVRPLEDPYLVGEVAAARARRERLARENGDDVLHSEDRRWDWFLAQTKDWEERDVSWKQFRREMQQTTSRGRLARRIGVGR